MENNPKKSKAFIIAFILILLLLIGGYYLFKNSSSIFGTKGSTTISKVFAPLLGTSKNKDLTVIVDPNAKIPTTPNLTPAAPSITGIVITDNLGNRIVRAEAGEDLKKGDVLYISGFNANKDPIVMKAISSDKSKSLVFGVAAEDMLKGKMGNVIIEGILTGIPTNKKEVTVWAANNPLYLSDKIYGGMTKNPPSAPSFVVPVGSVIKVDAKNGSIRIGGIITPSTTNYGTNTGSGTSSGVGTNSVFNPNINKNVLSNLKSFNSQLLNDSGTDLRGYFSSIYGADAFTNLNLSNTSGFNLNPINLPAGGDFSGNNYSGSGVGGGSNNGGGGNTNNGGSNGTPNLGGGNAGGDTAPPNDPNLPNLNLTTNSCSEISDNPLVFNEDEKARLAVLLRKFYLISSSLKTVEDITTISNEIDQNQNFISQIEDLTKQCYDQVTPKMIIDNSWVRHGNPWYAKATDGDFPYTRKGDVGYVDYSQLDGGATRDVYKFISGYYYGKTSSGIDCNTYNTFQGYGMSKQINDNPGTYLGHYWGEGSKSWESNGGGYPGDSLINYNGNLDSRQPDQKILESGCSWKDGVDLKNTEKLLNIW